MENLFDLSGRVAVLTGGMGLLGGEYADVLTEAGAKVAIFDIGEASEKIKNLLKIGRPILGIRANITKKAEVEFGMRSALNHFGAPVILINNAGVDLPPHLTPGMNSAFENLPEDYWDLVIDSHLKGAFLVSQAFVKYFPKNNPPTGGGSIINVSSTYGVVSPDQSLYDYKRAKGENFFKPLPYSVAKSGMLNFTRWLAEYCQKTGLPIRVNTLVPGGVYSGQEEEFVKEYSKRTILGRMAERNEYNGALLFLASRASSYMTGAMLTVDGGWTAK